MVVQRADPLGQRAVEAADLAHGGGVHSLTLVRDYTPVSSALRRR
jgi:hypothetical protein